jgi:hypothetical protein
MPPRLLEGLLCDVIGGRRIADDGQRHADGDPLEAARERGIPRAQASEQYLIRQPLACSSRSSHCPCLRATGRGMTVGRLTGRPLLRSGLRQLALGGVAFAVGSLIGGHVR